MKIGKKKKKKTGGEKSKMVIYSKRTRKEHVIRRSVRCAFVKIGSNWRIYKGQEGGRVPVGQEIVRAEKYEKGEEDNLRRNICQSSFFFWHVFDWRRDENFVLY